MLILKDLQNKIKIQILFQNKKFFVVYYKDDKFFTEEFLDEKSMNLFNQFMETLTNEQFDIYADKKNYEKCIQN
jgi:hypothetical protein